MVDDASGARTPGPSASDQAPTPERSGVEAGETNPPDVAAVTAGPVTPAPVGAGTAPPLVRILPLPAPSQRAVLIIAAAIVLGTVLWMGGVVAARSSSGSCSSTCSTPSSRASRASGCRAGSRSCSCIVVVILIIELFALTLGPLVAQISQFVKDFPALSAALERAARHHRADLSGASTAGRRSARVDRRCVIAPRSSLGRRSPPRS